MSSESHGFTHNILLGWVLLFKRGSPVFPIDLSCLFIETRSNQSLQDFLLPVQVFLGIHYDKAICFKFSFFFNLFFLHTFFFSFFTTFSTLESGLLLSYTVHELSYSVGFSHQLVIYLTGLDIGPYIMG